MQLFTRQAAQLLYSNQRLQRWCFDVELLFLAQHLKVSLIEESVHWTEIPGDPLSTLMCAEHVCAPTYLVTAGMHSLSFDMLTGSKVSLTSVLHMTWEMTAILIAYRWLKLWKIRSLAEVNKP